MPFGLPNLDWSTWLLIALCGVVLAALIPRLAPVGSRVAGKLTFILVCIAALCGVIGVVHWFGEQ